MERLFVAGAGMLVHEIFMMPRPQAISYMRAMMPTSMYYTEHRQLV